MGANQHLATIRTFLANDTDFATETTLAGIAETLDQIKLSTERVADAPLVQGLVDAGVAFPNDPLDPTNAAFTESPIVDILSRGGLGLFAAFSNLNQRIAEMVEPTPDLMQIGSAESPGFFNILNLPEVQKVEVTNKVKTQVEGTVDVKHVGALAVTQGGEFVVQLASGGVIPVYVQGGSVQANISQGGISTLAELIDVENQRRDAFNTAI